MHELSIAEALVKAVKREIGARPLGAVKAIHVQVGQLRLIEPVTLRTCYEATARENGLYGSRLDIETVPARAQCQECGERFAVDEPAFLCPHCDSADVELLAGKELTLTEIELEQAQG